MIWPFNQVKNKVELNNINKPTSAFWGKIQLACTAVSGTMATFALLSESHTWVLIAGILGCLGVVIPIFMKE